MKVFRIQDKVGRGPWKPGFSHKWVVSRPDHDNLPAWTFEFGLDNILDQIKADEHCGCGCRNIKQLRRWITRREYKKLLKFGYKCVSLSGVRVIAESDIQCVFARTKPLKLEAKAVKLYWPI